MLCHGKQVFSKHVPSCDLQLHIWGVKCIFVTLHWPPSQYSHSCVLLLTEENYWRSILSTYAPNVQTSETKSAGTSVWCWANIKTSVFRIFSHSSSPSRKWSAYGQMMCLLFRGCIPALFQPDLSLRLGAKQDPPSQVTVLVPFLFNIFLILLLPSETNTLYYHKTALRYTSNTVIQITKLKKGICSSDSALLVSGTSVSSTYELPNQNSFNLSLVAHRKASSLQTPIADHEYPASECCFPSQNIIPFIMNTDDSHHTKTIQHD